MKYFRAPIRMFVLWVLCFSPVFATATREMRGTIIAYDPTYHSLKQPSFVKNLEVTIAEVGKTGNQTFVKIVFEGFGSQQLADVVLKGQKQFKVRGVRDTSCDEDHPRVLAEDNSFQGSGTFVLNQVHRTELLKGISRLECYRVQVTK